MRQVTDTPTVLDCAMNFVEAADDTLKRIAWPGYVCFTREKQHYELPSQFSIKYEDLLPVPREPATFLNKEDIKRLNNWRNDFGRGVRQQSVRNSFTKDKAGTLSFYMYTSVDAYDSTEKQALTSIQELFKAMSSEKEADTQVHPSDANDFFGTMTYLITDESCFLFETSSEEAKCKKSDVICEIGEDLIRLFNGRLELTEERFCQNRSDCRGECDLETNETEENQEC
ncbi:hypothetical protein AWC38_SpisGene4832 [Stylophora pistillata]|uniref:Uncharacterized protein n=1 Tax=Stylophora pistillata TaxID=50429 RepID=A0A2B4SP58_STYPI|nr:hypothetical protein AWC38_SpisGene4832 [Stylophora pistillata]